jgi:D-glycero-D-manno-heptose 1,7-bisphosphate phosphatase
VPRRAVFLDRDGVLNAVVPDPVTGRPESPLHARDTELLPGVADEVRALQADGWAVVVASNQPGAAKGKASLEDLYGVHAVVRDGLPDIDGWRYCLHHPDGVDPLLSGPCPCRKPAPGMLIEAAFVLDLDLRSSWMVGDSDGDVSAGSAAGCRTVLAEHPDSVHRRSAGVTPTLTVASLPGLSATLASFDRSSSR